MRKSLPFRDAHEVVGRTVKLACSRGCGLEDLTLADLKSCSPLFEADALEVLNHASVMRARVSEGGTGPSAVRDQLAKAKFRQ